MAHSKKLGKRRFSKRDMPRMPLASFSAYGKIAKGISQYYFKGFGAL
jgi:hypothetical protein